MRLLFVYYLMNDAGSAQDVHNFTRVARQMGHEVAVYGRDPETPFRLSKEVRSADAVAFIFEWTTQLRYGGGLDLARILDEVPRHKRIVIDCDGAYHDAISLEGDYKHPNADSARRWGEVGGTLSDHSLHAAVHPRGHTVRAFF